MAEEFQLISINEIKVQKRNVRIHDIDLGIEDLAESIRANGLLQPVLAFFDSNNTRYVILAGQRRLDAYHYLNEKYPNQGFDKILCKVIDEPETEEKKKSISLAENITQLPMTNADLTKAVTDLFDIYGKYKPVQEHFGISKKMVQTHVRMHRLPKLIRDAVDTGNISSDPKKAVSAALKAVDAYDYITDSPTPVETVIEMAKMMADNNKIATDIQTEVKKGGTNQEILTRAKKKSKSPLSVDLTAEYMLKLNKVSESTGDSPVTRATSYVVKGIDKDVRQLGD